MSKIRIIHPNEDNSITIVTPALNCGIPIEEIARKDVPAGVPFRYMDESLIPPDLEYWAAWEADFSNPDGYGIGADAWFAEQAQLNRGA